MNRLGNMLAIVGLQALLSASAPAATLYVWTNSPSPGAPYNAWTNAARTIQAAVDYAQTNDTVLVTNGTYNVSNQISVTLGITVQGVGGASSTIVCGGYPTTTNRLFSMTDSNAVVDGFTITNGYLFNANGGGVYMTGGMLQNCTVAGCTVTNVNPQAEGGGVYMRGGTVSNCVIIGNWARGTYTWYNQPGGGGGIYIATNGIVRDSVLAENTAHAGGGVYMSGGGVSNCTIRGNVATIGGYEPPGGGVYKGGGTLAYCLIVSNSAVGGNANGGGLCGGAGPVQNCTFMGNSAANGGGVYFPAGGSLQSCLVIGNSAQSTAGGVGGQWGSTLQNCTVSGNSAGNAAGGVSGGQAGWLMSLKNSIVYFNTAPVGANWQPQSPPGAYYTNISSCIVPALDGTGGITNDPKFVNAAANDYRLLSISPCINTGTNQAWMTNAVDLAGNPRILDGIVDMGAYEFKSNELQCTFVADSPVGFLPHPVVFTAYVSGTNLSGLYYQWDFNGDGTVDTQGASVSIVTNTYTCGWYTVSLTVTNSGGEIAAATNVTYVRAGPATNYVSLAGLHLFPYTNWTMAATNIQAAADAGVDGTLVLVTNGTYSITNQISITHGITVRSMNGASSTVAKGPGTANHRIFYLSHPGAVVDGLTITNGYETYGGGVYIQNRSDLFADIGGTLRNCAINGNSADNWGGGVYVWYGGRVENCTINGNSVHNQWYGGGGLFCSVGGTAQNCVIQGNRTTAANTYGGGACYGTLYNCTVISNSAWSGGGAYGATLSNCIVYYNTATVASNNIYGSTATFTCTTPEVGGAGNITNEPQFVNMGAGDYHFRFGSPCIDAGTNVPGVVTDLEGNARPLDGNWDGTNRQDMGCYEYNPQTADSNGDGIPDWWSYRYRLDPNDPGMGSGNPDSDPFTTAQEWIADTDPTNPASCLYIEAVSNGPPIRLYFDSSSNRNYTLAYVTNLVVAAWTNLPGQQGVRGCGGPDFMTDTNAPPSNRYYRLRVELP